MAIWSDIIWTKLNIYFEVQNLKFIKSLSPWSYGFLKKKKKNTECIWFSINDIDRSKVVFFSFSFNNGQNDYSKWYCWFVNTNTRHNPKICFPKWEKKKRRKDPSKKLCKTCKKSWEKCDRHKKTLWLLIYDIVHLKSC